MKTSTATDVEIDRDGITSDSSFGIVFNAKMAKILSDGLYSDKIKSIIRELSSNAYDSHVAAGTTDPFEVHLPNTFEPWFSIKDFGVGLDHKQVLEVYTVYGVSTKTDSNDYVGQLGLGSKSPFSYVDAFDVIAVKDGIERQYSMYKNEKGMPSVALLGEKNTKDRNGLTVKIPVLVHDYNKFIEKASSVYQWYDTPPTVTGASLPPRQKYEYVFEGKNWKIVKDQGRGSFVPTALMGRVAYPLSYSSINNLTQAEQRLIAMPIILNFEIGELEVSASRESLGYDPRTQDNIKAVLSSALKELADIFEKKMVNCKTEWEAREQFDKLFNDNYYIRSDLIAIFGNQGLKWKNNIVINSGTVTLNPSDLWDSSALSSPIMYSLSSGQKRCRQMNFGNITIKCSSNTTFIFDDLDKGVLSRSQYYHEQNGSGKTIYIIGPSTEKTVTEIVKMLGKPPIIMASSLPKRPSAANKSKISMLQLNDSGYNSGRKAWSGVNKDVSDGGIYVILDHWDVMSNNQKIDNFLGIVSAARKAKILDATQKIYAPRGKLKDVLEKDSGWISFWDHCQTMVKKLATTAVLQAAVDNSAYIEVTNNNSYFKHTFPWTKVPGSVMIEFADAMEKMKKASSVSSSNANLIEFARLIDIHLLKTITPSIDIKSLYEKMNKTYPLINALYNNGYYRYTYQDNDMKKMCVEYVELVDKHHNCKP